MDQLAVLGTGGSNSPPNFGTAAVSVAMFAPPTAQDLLGEHACSVLGATICDVYHNVYSLEPTKLASKRKRDCDEGT
jgi:hypothetical protein